MTARFSVVIARPGYTTVAMGPYAVQDFAGLVAWNLRKHLRNEAAQVEVEPFDDTLTHLPLLPTTAPELAELLAADSGTADRLDVHARLAAQVGGTEARLLLAEAHMLRANALWAEVAAA